MRILNEKEIQEKLYGQYRAPKQSTLVEDSTAERGSSQKESLGEKWRETTSEPVGKSKVEQKRSKPFESLPVYNSEHLNSTFESNQSVNYILAVSRNLYSFLVKNFTWKRGSIFLVVCIGLILITHRLWNPAQKEVTGTEVLKLKPAKIDSLLKTSPTSSKNIDVQKTKLDFPPVVSRPVTEEPKSSTSLPEKPVVPVVSKPVEKSAPSVLPTANPPALPVVFTIQVCTYRLESDATKLVERLKALGLPVHYVGQPAATNETPRFFIVFLGKDSTYSEAQARLTQFKKLSVSREFSDAYIRKL